MSWYIDLFRSQYRKDEAPSRNEGLTMVGRRIILHNIWTCINMDFSQLKHEIYKDDPSPMIYNSLIFRLTIGMQSLLDSIAKICDDLYPLQPSMPGYRYFHNYGFLHTEFNTLRIHYQNIENLRFQGKNFNTFANKMKHELPWVGLCVMDSNGIVDIFDNDDECRTGLIDDILYKVLKNSLSMLNKLENIIKEK
jgi:hypothetical protein